MGIRARWWTREGGDKRQQGEWQGVSKEKEKERMREKLGLRKRLLEEEKKNKEMWKRKDLEKTEEEAKNTRERQEESTGEEVLSERACVVSYGQERQFVKLVRHWMKGKTQITKPKLRKLENKNQRRRKEERHPIDSGIRILPGYVTVFWNLEMNTRFSWPEIQMHLKFQWWTTFLGKQVS